MNRKKLFGTDGVRGKVGHWPVSADGFLKIGWAFGVVLAQQKQQGRAKVLIGKDTRISGYMFESALEAGLVAAGVDVGLLGPMPTPGIAYLTKTFKADAGIVISASHNSYLDNGIKFFTIDGMKLSVEQEQAIEAKCYQVLQTVAPSSLGKASRIDDAQGRYIEFCKSTLASNINLSGLHIVVDAANGAAYNLAPCVFNELGAKVTVIGNKPDGLNINQHCGATCPQTLVSEVIKNQADLGVALDGDADRLIMVDSKGNIVDGDDLLYIIAGWYKHYYGKLDGLVGTLMSNLGLEQAMQQLSIPFVRSNVGDKNIQAALKARGWLLGGEPSGHILCLDSHVTGDGIIAALKVLAAMVTFEKPLGELTQGLNKYPQIVLNVPLNNIEVDYNSPVLQKIITQAEKKLGNKGRILLRPSGTEPLLRIMVEGDSLTVIEQVANNIANQVTQMATA